MGRDKGQKKKDRLQAVLAIVTMIYMVADMLVKIVIYLMQ